MKHLFAAVAVGALSSTAALAQEPLKLRFANFEPPASYGTERVYTPWIESINEASEGALEIEMFAGGQLGKPAAQLKTVQNGVADLGLIIPSFTPGRFPGNDIAELPFLWSDPLHASLAVAQMVEDGELDYPGIEVLGIAVAGPYILHTRPEVDGLADVEGLKIRAAGPIYADVAQALGAAGVGMPVSGVAENISRGVIDGVFLDWSLMDVFRVSDVATHHVTYPLGGVILLIGMNEDVYENLPPKARAAVDAAKGESFARLWAEVQTDESARVRDRLSAHSDHTVVELSPEERERWDAAVKPVIEEWASASGENAALLESFEAALAKQRAAE